MVLSAAVTAGIITPPKAWPDMFEGLQDDGSPDAFPSTDADMSDFRLEEASPESFLHDMDLLEQIAASQQLVIREEDPPPFPRLEQDLPHPEWT